MKHLAIALFALLVCSTAHAGNCYVMEFQRMILDSNGSPVPVANLDPGNAPTQKIAYTTASLSGAFGSATRFVRVICDAKAFFKITNASVPATANDAYIPPDSAEYFGVTPGWRLSFYDGTS